MGTIFRLFVSWCFVMIGHGMWASTMSPHWAGPDAWNLFSAGFFWSAAAILAWDVIGTARDWWVAAKGRWLTSA
jgi:hypothetical protein